MRFEDIPGHAGIKARLTAMADIGKVPHALLLEGPAGSGKFGLARAFAQYLHCENRANGDSCGKCPSCLQHQAFNHIDTIYSFPVVKKGTGSATVSDDYISEFRNFMDESPYMDFETWLLRLDNINAQPQMFVEEANDLMRKLSFTAHNSRYKIVLMWLPERLKDEAANKLLKLIEEPHSDTLFVMTSDNSRLILPTIYSRTQRVSVPRYSDEEVVEYLTRNYSIELADAARLAPLAIGNLALATGLIGVSKERQRFLDLFAQLMRMAYTRDVAALKEWASSLAELGRERQMAFYDYCGRLLRENFILNIRTPNLNMLTDTEMQFCSRFSPFINERNVIQLFNVVNEARADIAANGNAKLINFDVAIKTILLLKA